MSAKFPRAPKSVLGYDIDQVEAFLGEARLAYGGDSLDRGGISVERIRHTAFAMQKGGYETGPVDEALERLEDAFASREHEFGEAAGGPADREARIDEIVARLTRPPGERFERVGILASGYHRGDVDSFADRLTRNFQEDVLVSLAEVRSAAFRARRGGYREAQVDLLLDAVIDIMLADRA